MSENETKQLLEDMLHPVRMRILTALAGSQGQTPLQLAEQLSDVPQATLYRQIARLNKSELIQVVDERPVRGTVEKVYALNTAQTFLSNEAISQLSKEDHLRFFTAFTINLIEQFSRYLNHQARVDLAADGVGYTQVALWLSDAELAEFARQVNLALLPYVQAAGEPAEAPDPAHPRKKRLFTTVMLPEVSGK